MRVAWRCGPCAKRETPLGTVIRMGWNLDEFSRSLTAVAPSTVEAYARDLRSFTTWAGRLGLDSPGGVDRQVLRRYLAYLATRGQARRTIARRASALRRYFGWLVRTGRLDRDPTVGLSAPKGEARLPRVLRPDELRALLGETDAPTPQAAEGVEMAVDMRDTALLELLYGSGLRVAEATGLDVDEVDLPAPGSWCGARGPSSAPCRSAIRPRPPSAAGSATAGLIWRPRRLPAAPSSSTVEATGSPLVMPGGCSTGAPSSPPIPTHCATRSQRTCSTGALTCESSKSSSAIQTWRPPSVTLTSRRNG